MTTKTIRPTATRLDVVLKATSPISHHDATIQDGSNMLLFNRQKQVVRRPDTARTESDLGAFFAHHPVPVELRPIFEQMSPAEFIASAIVKLFAKEYSTLDGVGMFTGMRRYTMFERRIRPAAVRSSNLRSFWNRLTQGLNVEINQTSLDEELVRFFALPTYEQVAALSSIAKDYRTATITGRLWATDLKKKDVETVVIPASAMEDIPELAVIDVPTISGNSLRHQMIRASSWTHLVAHLGIEEAFPGEGFMPPGTEALFVNGGNISAGSTQMSNAFTLAEMVRKTFPSLDLLGGVCDSFDLGEGRLSVTPYLICKENREAIAGLLYEESPMLDISAFDLLDDVTLTRQATGQGVGQMIYNFESLAAGTEVLVRFALQPQTPELTVGAFAAAIEMFSSNTPHIGGQKRAGFGAVTVSAVTDPTVFQSSRAQYEGYLQENKDRLLEELASGKLGTGKQVTT